MTPLLPGDINGRRFLRALSRFGWVVVRVKGSHRVLRKEGVSRVVVVAFHQTISRNAARNVLSDAGIDEREFEREL